MIEKVMNALAHWVVRAANKEEATPEEIAALAVIAKIVADYAHAVLSNGA